MLLAVGDRELAAVQQVGDAPTAAAAASPAGQPPRMANASTGAAAHDHRQGLGAGGDPVGVVEEPRETTAAIATARSRPSTGQRRPAGTL